MTKREQMLSDIIIGAVEGGTGYWATVEAYHWSGDDSYPAVARLREIEAPHREIDLNVVSVENAMFRVAHDHGFGVNSTIRWAIGKALATDDASDCDSDVADVVAQAAVFGEVVYG